MELLDKTRGPLPGGATNNRKYVINYMRSNGFEVQVDTLSEYPVKYNFYLRGELVGWSYENVMYLQPVLPSLVEISILAQRAKTEITFDLPGVEVHDRLRDAVKELKKSYDSYDELLKRSRVQKIREYFKYKNIEKERVKARVKEYHEFRKGLVREYNELMKGLMR